MRDVAFDWDGGQRASVERGDKCPARRGGGRPPARCPPDSPNLCHWGRGRGELPGARPDLYRQYDGERRLPSPGRGGTEHSDSPPFRGRTDRLLRRGTPCGPAPRWAPAYGCVAATRDV